MNTKLLADSVCLVQYSGWYYDEHIAHARRFSDIHIKVGKMMNTQLINISLMVCIHVGTMMNTQLKPEFVSIVICLQVGKMYINFFLLPLMYTGFFLPIKLQWSFLRTPPNFLWLKFDTIRFWSQIRCWGAKKLDCQYICLSNYLSTKQFDLNN